MSPSSRPGPYARADATIRGKGREPIASARLEQRWRRVPVGGNSAELATDGSVVDAERTVSCYGGVHVKGEGRADASLVTSGICPYLDHHVHTG